MRSKDNRFSTLEAIETAYRSRHPATADMDFLIFRAHCAGESALRISLDVPCSESTVYRAIRRVKDFLSSQEEVPIWATVRQYAMEHEPNYGDWNAQSLLEMLYVVYTDYNQIDIGCNKNGFVTLRKQLSAVPQIADSVLDTVFDLCHCHERAGFTEGMKLGVRLYSELSAGKEV